MKKEKGITLIALVITIIVLLILAGVTLSTLFGNNGILTESQLAVEANKEANAKEQVQLAWTACETEYQAAWTKDSSVVKKDYFDADDLNKNLGTGTVKSVGYVENGKSTVTYTLDGTEYEFEITNGQVYKVGQAPDVTEPTPSEPERVDGSSADWKFDVATGTILSMKLNESGIYRINTSTITIPNYIDGVKVKKIGSLYEDGLGGSFGIESGGEYLDKIIISDGIEEIGNYAFYNCKASKIIIPNSVIRIESGAFAHSSLEELYIPASVSYAEDLYHGCSHPELKYIEVDDDNPNYNDGNGSNILVNKNTKILLLGTENSIIPEGITSIGWSAFDGDENLTEIKLPNTLERIECWGFYGTGLTSISIPSTVTFIHLDAFSDCRKLESINIASGSSLTEYSEGYPWGLDESKIHFNQ